MSEYDDGLTPAQRADRLKRDPYTIVSAGGKRTEVRGVDVYEAMSIYAKQHAPRAYNTAVTVEAFGWRWDATIHLGSCIRLQWIADHFQGGRR